MAIYDKNYQQTGNRGECLQLDFLNLPKNPKIKVILDEK